MLHTLLSAAANDEYDPQLARRKMGEYFTDIQTRELSRHYDTYFSLTSKAKYSLASSLGIPVYSLRKWMYRMRQKQNELSIIQQQHQTPSKRKHVMTASGSCDFNSV